MRYLKDFQKFKKIKESIDGYELPFRIDLKESITTSPKDALDAVDAVELDIYQELNIDPEEVDIKMDLESFVEAPQVLSALSRSEIRIGDVEKTEDSETFLSTPMIYVCLYDKASSDLQHPNYLLLQLWQEETKNRTPIALYKVKDDFKKFYDKLSSKVVELEVEGEKLIYKTDNSGNNWTVQIPKDGFKSEMTNKEMWEMMHDKNIKVKVLH